MREITWCVEGALNVLSQSFSSMSIYRTGLQMLSILSHLRPFSAAFVLRMRSNGYLWTSGINLDTAVRFADPDFLLECKMSAILRRFPLIFFILHAECPLYFYFRFVWSTDLGSIPHASTPTSIIPTKVEAPTPIRSWVMSDNVSHWLPLKCVRCQCACAESRDPWVGGQKQLHFWNPRQRFAYSLYNFGGSTMNIIKVICENNARPCVKKRMRFCACAKSRDLLKVT